MRTRSTILAFVIVAVAGTVAAVRSQAPTFQGGVDVVRVGVTVLDKQGSPIIGFTADDFELVEDGHRQTIRYFSPGDAADGAPGAELHLGLVVDASESMGEDIRFTHNAAVKFVNTLTDAVDVTIVDFDAEVRTARYEQSDFKRLIERIRLGKARGMTALYDAIGVYLDGAAGQNGRKIMLLYTDGGDTTSAMSFGDLLDLLKASDVTVYVIGELDHQPASLANEQRMILRQIADVTGGQVFFPASVKDLDRVYERVVSEIRSQYTLGYVSTNEAADGAWRKVEIKARKDGRPFKVRARKGYFGPYKRP